MRPGGVSGPTSRNSPARRPDLKILATPAGARDPDTGESGCEQRSISAGAHGERIYDWTAVALATAGLLGG